MSTATLQVLDPEGKEVGAAPQIPDDDLRKMFRHMLLLRTFDQRMLSLQRQGRIGFYGTGTGEEAAITGSAYPQRDSDWVFPALRQMGVAIWRGSTIKQVVCQLIGNSGDVLIGRQMPCHFSDRAVNTVAWSSVIGTQLPQAMGAAWAAKIKKHDTVCMGYLGDGASSIGDFHAAANFAGVYKLPVVFFCQNNQWAISVPLSAQTASESIAIKAKAYGFDGVRVDGNDVLAVAEATRVAIDRARSGGGPTLIEALTYRMGGHSSSDDPTRYRDDEQVEYWKVRDPLNRFRVYLEGKSLLAAGEEQTWTDEIIAEISAAIEEAEKLPAPGLETLFSDVYAEMPWHLEEQKRYALAIGEGDKIDGAFPL